MTKFVIGHWTFDVQILAIFCELESFATHALCTWKVVLSTYQTIWQSPGKFCHRFRNRIFSVLVKRKKKVCFFIDLPERNISKGCRRKRRKANPGGTCAEYGWPKRLILHENLPHIASDNFFRAQFGRTKVSSLVWYSGNVISHSFFFCADVDFRSKDVFHDGKRENGGIR